MRHFLLSNGPLVVWFIILSEILLLYLALHKEKKTLILLVAAITAGLIIDAFIQATGTLLGEGILLQGISQIRYILHGILVPLMVPIAFYGYGLKSKKSQVLVLGVTGVIVFLGILMGILTKTEPVFHAGILRYASSKATPVFASKMDRVLSIGGVIPLIVMGVLHLIHHKSPFLMLSGISMFAFSALAPATGNMDLNFLISMIGELLMVSFFLLEIYCGQKEAKH